jgi:hypothetical protein
MPGASAVNNYRLWIALVVGSIALAFPTSGAIYGFWGCHFELGQPALDCATPWFLIFNGVVAVVFFVVGAFILRLIRLPISKS